MLYPSIDFQNQDLTVFIRQWNSFYNYDKMNLYDDNIKKETLTKEDLINLFVWKNGTNLSESKKRSLEKNVLSKLDLVNKFKKSFNIKTFLKEFKDVSFVWKIFLLHIVNPLDYPIYDQHIHRAFLFFNKDIFFKEIDNNISLEQKDAFYFGNYMHFVTKLRVEDNYKIQDLDRAFFSFGQFLKKYKVEL
jgi:hypothetical protein